MDGPRLPPAPSVRVRHGLGNERRPITVVQVVGEHDYASRGMLEAALAPATSRRASPRRTRRGVRPARPKVDLTQLTTIDWGAPEADSDAGRRCAKCGLDSPVDRTAGPQTDGRSSAAAPGGTTRTGQRATPTSALETLPRNTALKAPRPREPTTIISARSSSATSARHSAGSP